MAGNSDDQDADYQFKLTIIKEVSLHPFIYDKAHKDHLKCDKKDAVF